MSALEQNFLEGKRIVILGAGYVGSALALEAKARGAQVLGVTRNAETCAQLRSHGIEMLQAQLASDDWHARAGRADFALLCVGSGGGTSPEAYRTSYVDGMRSALRWAAKRGVGTLVYTSSTSVYPQGNGAHVTERDQRVAPGLDMPGTLAEAEDILLAHGAEIARAFILRLAGIYGPGRHGFLDRLIQDPLSVPGEATAHLNLIHRDDIVSAVLTCWGASSEHRDLIFNVADQGQATRGEIASWLAQRAGLASVSFTGAPAVGRRRLTPDRIVDADLLQRTLGWRPRFPTFREGYDALLRQ